MITSSLKTRIWKVLAALGLVLLCIGVYLSTTINAIWDHVISDKLTKVQPEFDNLPMKVEFSKYILKYNKEYKTIDEY